jgi:hypothetical protein
MIGRIKQPNEEEIVNFGEWFIKSYPIWFEEYKGFPSKFALDVTESLKNEKPLEFADICKKIVNMLREKEPELFSYLWERYQKYKNSEFSTEIRK